MNIIKKLITLGLLTTLLLGTHYLSSQSHPADHHVAYEEVLFADMDGLTRPI